MANIIGLSESALSRYLKGHTEMLGDEYIIKIAKHFRVSTDFLLGETDIPDRKNYDIEELGLSTESAKLLYTGKIDSGILLVTDDLVQEALIGVLRAVKTYDPETGNLFLTYAQTTAENAMLDYVRKCASTLPAAFSVLTLRRRDLIPKQMSLMQISSRTITLKILSSSLSEKRPLQKSEMPLEKSLIVNGPIFITAMVFSIVCFMIKAKPPRIFISV